MRKFLCYFVTLLLLCIASPSDSAVGVKSGTTRIGTATDFNFVNAGTAITSDGSTVSFENQLVGVGKTAAVSLDDSQANVNAKHAHVRKAIATTTAGTLSDGRPGQLVKIYVTERSGGNWTLTPSTSTTFNSILFNAADETVTLLFIDTTTGWIVLDSSGATVSYK